MKTPLKNYLSITKTEWNGLVILIVLIAGVIAIPYVYPYFNPEPPVGLTKLDRAMVQLKQAGYTGDTTDTEHSSMQPAKLFAFDPNNLPADQWQKLGLTARQIKGIKNYEAAGGRFYTKADVKKMYTLTPQDYHRLEPYINISKHISAEVKIIELNTADSATLTHLKGIGPTFAHRIIQYRDRLGGFHSKLQLKEIFGMDDMHYRDIQSQFRVNAREVKQIDVNTVELPDIKNFPYLNYKQANALVQYRKQHGNYERFEELANVAILDAGVLKKIRPYVLIR